jgi:phage terminase large subunit-like protein
MIPPETWAACRGTLSDWSKATTINGGFDLGRSNDMAGAAIVAQFNCVDDNGDEFVRYEVQSAAWTCRERAEEVDTPQVAEWIREGYLNECSGNQIYFQDVEDWIVSQTSLHVVRTWAYDPANASQIGQRLQEEHGIRVFPFVQNAIRYNEPMRTLERLVNEVRIVGGKPVRGITHDGDPVLAWMMTNLIARRNNKDQWMPDKSASPQKIDIAVSVLMALSECMFSQRNVSTGKFYEVNELEIA